MIIKGMFWHVHHDELLEYCYDYDERVRFIKENKPKNERELRLRLCRPVKGKLPIAVKKAGIAYSTAAKAYIETPTFGGDIWSAMNKSRKAYQEVVEDNMPAIEELHRKECPDCPWDGKTIFGE